MNTKTVTNAPRELIGEPYFHRDLQLDGITIVESCTHTQRRQGAMFLEDHMLMYIIEGKTTIKIGLNEYIVRTGEMIILKKGTYFTYDKVGNPDKNHVFESLLFFLKETFVKEFIKFDSTIPETPQTCPEIEVKKVDFRLEKFFESVVPYFEEPENIDGNLVRLKMIELLFDLLYTDQKLLHQLTLLNDFSNKDIPTIVNEFYASPLTLKDMALHSGRSLSTFKRDFYSIYNMPPARWIRDKRMAKAKEMLLMSIPIKDICYLLGFENVAHFSRLYKSYHGEPPSAHRQSLLLA